MSLAMLFGTLQYMIIYQCLSLGPHPCFSSIDTSSVRRLQGCFWLVAGMASGTWQMLYKSMLLSWLRGWMDGWVEDRWVDEGIEYWFNVFFGLFVVIVFILFFYTASIPTSNIPLRFFVESLLPKRTQSRRTCCPNTKSFPGFSLTLFPS